MDAKSWAIAGDGLVCSLTTCRRCADDVVIINWGICSVFSARTHNRQRIFFSCWLAEVKSGGAKRIMKFSHHQLLPDPSEFPITVVII